ncbi:glycosyltransferase family 4 protein [Peijinzhouia sedimentorum]
MEVVLLGEWNSAVDIEIKEFPFIQSIKIPKWHTKNWRLKRLSELYNWWLAKREVKKWMNKNKHKFDVLHSFNSWSNLNLAAVEIASQLGKKAITETCLIGADDPKTLFKEKPKYKWSAQYYRKLAYLKADTYISKSSYMTTFFGGLISREKVAEVPYFVDVDKFKPLSVEEKIELREKYGLPVDKRIILFAGATCHRKGTDLLIRAFDYVHHLYPETYLILAGPYDNDEQFNEPIKLYVKQNSASVKHYEQRIEFIDEIMNLADIYCLPSLKEGLPISILEALCAGRVIVASAIPEIKDVQIRDEENGILFKTNDIEDLKLKLREVVESYDVLNKNYLLVNQHASHSFSIAKIFISYLELYKRDP